MPSFKLPSIPGRASKQQRQEATIDDVLPDSNQRIDLLVLVAVCTDNMRDVLATSSRNDATSMAQLQSSATEYLNTWRSSVLRRMGEAMNVRSDSVTSAKARYTSSIAAVARQRAEFEHYRQEDGRPQVQPTEDAAKIILPFPKVDLPDAIRTLEEKDRALVLGAVLFMLLSLENYTAYSRVLAAYLCKSLELPLDVLHSVETTTAATLLDAANKAGMEAEDARKKKEDDSIFGRKWKIGLAGVAGAAVIGITGGLAAPLILGVAGSVMGAVGLGGLATLLGATIANPITIGALFGALGGRMTSRAMDAYSKEVQDFKFLPISETKPELLVAEDAGSPASTLPPHKLRVAIGISGWVNKESDVSMPWRVFSSTSLEAFALRYEQDALISLSTQLNDVLKGTAYGIVRGKAIGFVLPALAAAMAPVALLKAGRFLDNPFTIALERSDKAGRVLAQALIDKAQGERPVTLVGFSMGAKVVSSCLEELASKGAFGLIENAILIGAPVPSSNVLWRRMRAVVTGRLVNVYSENDMILGYLYRARNLTLNIAGLQPIEAVSNVENKDASSFVDGHNQYCLAIGRTLQELDFADLDLEQVHQENLELESEKIYEQEQYEKAKQEGRLDDLEDEKGQIKMADANKATETNSPTDSAAGPASLAEKLDKTRIVDAEEAEEKPALPARPVKDSSSEAVGKSGDQDDADELINEPISMTEVEHEPIPDSPVTK